MKVLILGGSGMLGHKLWQRLSPVCDTYVTLRSDPPEGAIGLFDRRWVKPYVLAEDFDSVERAVATVRPEIIINCIGIVKAHSAAKDPLRSIKVNSLFPHELAQLSRATGIRLVHISTDCVFSGRKGNYTEIDLPDAEDLYGRTKLLGEISDRHALTIRTSMIGRELTGAHGLLEWFLSQEHQPLRGFTKAIFSGFTTSSLSEVIKLVLLRFPSLSGVWHVSADPISKFDLLTLIRDTYKLHVTIDADEEFRCDRSLDSTRFRKETGFVPAAWGDMVREIYEDTTRYAKLRQIFGR